MASQHPPKPKHVVPRVRRGWRACRPQPLASAPLQPQHNRAYVFLDEDASQLAERFSALWTLEDELCSLAAES